jgi:hypothetical protein
MLFIASAPILSLVIEKALKVGSTRDAARSEGRVVLPE